MEKSKLSGKEYLVLSSMLFGMFFGAGNLIFPVHLGQVSGRSMWPAVLGFCITGVGLPLLGVASMGISRSEGLFSMSSKVGKGFAYFFTCALYLTIGPLFAIPRTATVSFQVALAPFIAEDKISLALVLFSLLFFAACLFFSLRPNQILTWIGKVLNPAFLVLLAILLFVALANPMGNIRDVVPQKGYADFGQSLATGLLEGYNTMDALASLAFGIVLINSIRSLGVKDPKAVSSSTLKSGLLSMLLMAVIYGLLTWVGALATTQYGVAENGGVALGQIAQHYLGTVGAVILGLTITFACLKTAIGLVTSISTMFTEMFPKSLSYNAYAVIFVLFSFAISNIGLTKIIAFSVPALVFLYPLTISLILLCLGGRGFQYSRKVMVPTMVMTILPAVFEGLGALPKTVQTSIPGLTNLLAVYAKLPLATVGLGWLLPALLGLIFGLVWYGISRPKQVAA